MSDIVVAQMPAFKKAYKKLHKQAKKTVDDAIRSIIHNPKVGEEKKGDLSSVFVYKFKMTHQEMLLAYQWDSKHRMLLCLGVHENFYRDLKQMR